MLKFIIIFSICSFINVMLNTFKTIIMYDNNKLTSSLINAVCFGFYTVIVVMMAGEMALWLKVFITAITNFVGVWTSMIILDKIRKDKLWLVQATIRPTKSDKVETALVNAEIPYTVLTTNDNKHYVFNIFCATQKDSEMVKAVLTKYEAKYFVSENKTL